MNNNSLPWNYQVVFQLPPQTYYTTYRLVPSDPVADVESKLAEMTEYKDANTVLEKIKAL